TPLFISASLRAGVVASREPPPLLPRLAAGKLAALDQVTQTLYAEPFPERMRGVADRFRIGSGAHGRRTRQVEQHTEFAEVIAGPGYLDQFLTAFGDFAHDLELAFGNHIDQIAHGALLEQHLTGFHVHNLRRPARRRNSRYQVADT